MNVKTQVSPPCWAYAIKLFGRKPGIGSALVDARHALVAASYRPALLGGPRMSLPLPNVGIGDDGVTVCLVHIVMVDR